MIDWYCIVEHPIEKLSLKWICLFVWSFSSHLRIFHSYGEVIINSEGLQMLTSARHSWSLSSEGSLGCHTYCDMGHSSKRSAIGVSVTGPMRWPIAERLELSLPVFMTEVCHGWDSNTKPSTCVVNTLTHCTIAMASDIWKHHIYTHTVLQNVSLICCNKVFLQRIMFDLKSQL